MEVPVYVLALRDRPWRQRLWVAFMASTITHPIVWAMRWVLRRAARAAELDRMYLLRLLDKLDMRSTRQKR